MTDQFPLRPHVTMRPPTLEERKRLFLQGFADGAKGVPAKHENLRDYIQAYAIGQNARNDALTDYCRQEGIPHEARGWGDLIQEKKPRSSR